MFSSDKWFTRTGNWEELKGILKHRFQASRPVKAVRKALESLVQKHDQSVRDFTLEVEDLLAEFITASSVGMAGAQLAALAADREAQALEVFVDGLYDKLRDWAKARDFDTLKEAVDFAISEEHNTKRKIQSITLTENPTQWEGVVVSRGIPRLHLRKENNVMEDADRLVIFNVSVAENRSL